MSKKEAWIWMDGKMIPWDDARVHVLSHTLHYGYGAFEGIRAYGQENGEGAVFRLREHMARLHESAKLLELKVPWTVDELCDACVELLTINGLAEAYIRPLLFLGDRQLGVYPGDEPDVHLSIIAWKWGAYLGPEALSKGIRVKVSSYTKAHSNSLLIKGKVCGHYVNSVLTKMEAIREGYAEGILLDPNGQVCEGSGENLFVVKDGILYTPSTDTAILKGITRASVIELARQMGYEVREVGMTRDELYSVDEMFFTGTAAEVSPIREVDRRIVGEGCRGPITEKIQTAFFDILEGRNDKYAHWLTRYKPAAK